VKLKVTEIPGVSTYSTPGVV